MDRQEIKNGLIALAEKQKANQGKFNDIEQDHVDADNLLLELLDDPEVEKLWRAVDKWFA